MPSHFIKVVSDPFPLFVFHRYSKLVFENRAFYSVLLQKSKAKLHDI